MLGDQTSDPTRVTYMTRPRVIQVTRSRTLFRIFFHPLVQVVHFGLQRVGKVVHFFVWQGDRVGVRVASLALDV